MPSPNKKVIAVIQARMGSSRLPGKVLKTLSNKTVLSWVSDAARQIPGVDDVIVATSDLSADDAIKNWCDTQKITCYRGSETDVLSRFHLVATTEKADTIIRLTGDCPLLDPHVCGQVLTLFNETKADYTSNVAPATWPDGLDCEIVTKEALDIAMKEATNPSEREHVMPFFYKNPDRFRISNLPCSIPNLSDERWTLDTQDDFDFLEQVTAKLPSIDDVNYMNVLSIVRSLPTRTDSETRNAGYLKSVQSDDASRNTEFGKSNDFLKRSLKTIPIGSQTFSKSHLQYPKNEAPLFVSHAKGGRVWDIDGNEYVDLISGLLPVILGYCDPDVDQAIQCQLSKGISFSLATDLETIVSEKLCDIIPCAEMVRFGKNGTDATSAAIRLARAYTGRDKVMVAGYHGWQDWYIGSTTRHLGVPDPVRNLTHSVPYNDLDAIEKLIKENPDSFAAMILEPMNVVEPSENYLSDLKELLHKNNILLIFDEVITGFRYSLGGAQEYFNVTPDLAAFGKAMGNGMPISAIMGKAEIMRFMEDVFISGTFGGEALSLAATNAVIDKMKREPVIETVWQTGQILKQSVEQLVKDNNLENIITINGKAPWIVLGFNDAENASKETIRTFYIREMIANGILTQGSHNVSYAHNQTDIGQIVNAYQSVIPLIANHLEMGTIDSQLPYGSIEPVFKVR